MTRESGKNNEPSRPRGLRALALALGLALMGAPAAAEMMSLAMAQSGHVVQISKPASDADRVQALDLETGKSFFFSTDFRVRRVSVGDPKILDVVVLSPTELQLVPSLRPS
jgi:Flp pilus assembly secretin CpaC